MTGEKDDLGAEGIFSFPFRIRGKTLAVNPHFLSLWQKSQKKMQHIYLTAFYAFLKCILSKNYFHSVINRLWDFHGKPVSEKFYQQVVISNEKAAILQPESQNPPFPSH